MSFGNQLKMFVMTALKLWSGSVLYASKFMLSGRGSSILAQRK